MKYRISFLRELRFEIVNHGTEPLDMKDVVLKTSFKENMDLETNTLHIFFHSLFGLKDGDSIRQILHSDINVAFEFQELPRDKKKRKKELEMIFPNLLGITISTARGIIFSRTKGEPINEYILPIINPTTLMENRFSKEPFQIE